MMGEFKLGRGFEKLSLRYRAARKRFERSGASLAFSAGFTLLELTMVMAVILVLVAITFPAYRTAITRSKEAVLKDDLTIMRQVIDEFTVDKQRPPQSLDELVEAGYIHAIPVDPFTGAKDSWQPDIEEVPVPPDQNATGVVDVHSGADGEALDGTHYNTW